MTKQYDEEFKRIIVNEYLKGRSLGSIASEFGIAKSTVAKYRKKMHS